MRRAIWVCVLCLSVFVSTTAVGGDAEYQAWLHSMPLFEVNTAPTWFQYSSKPACMNQIEQTNYATTSHFSWVYDNPCYMNFISGIRSQRGPSPGVCHTFASFAAFEGQLKIDQTAKAHVPLQVEFDVDLSEEAFLVHWKGSDDCGDSDSAYYDLEELVDSGAVREHLAPWRGDCGGPDIDPEQFWHAKATDFHRITDDDTGYSEATIKAALLHGPVVARRWPDYCWEEGEARDRDNGLKIRDRCIECDAKAHVVAIVGWNDNVVDMDGTNHGAFWLIKNSWGDALFWLRMKRPNDDSVKYCGIGERTYTIVSTVIGCPGGTNCEQDSDGDGMIDFFDNCPGVRNVDQDFVEYREAAGTGFYGAGMCAAGYQGDDRDTDGDGFNDQVDNCIFVANDLQCSGDDDSKRGSVCNQYYYDRCEMQKMFNQWSECVPAPTDDFDEDGDYHGDAGDKCPCVSSKDNTDVDEDGLGDACDNDKDNDGVPDNDDHWPYNKFVAFDCDQDGRADRIEPSDDYQTCQGMPDRLECLCETEAERLKDLGVFPYVYQETGIQPWWECMVDNCRAPGLDPNLPADEYRQACLGINGGRYYNPFQEDCDGDKLGDKCDPDSCIGNLYFDRVPEHTLKCDPPICLLFSRIGGADIGFDVAGHTPSDPPTPKTIPDIMIGACPCESKRANDDSCATVCPHLKAREFVGGGVTGVRYFDPVHSRAGCGPWRDSSGYQCRTGGSFEDCSDLCAMKDLDGDPNTRRYSIWGWDHRDTNNPFFMEEANRLFAPSALGPGFEGRHAQLRVAFDRDDNLRQYENRQYYPPPSVWWPKLEYQTGGGVRVPIPGGLFPGSGGEDDPSFGDGGDYCKIHPLTCVSGGAMDRLGEVFLRTAAAGTNTAGKILIEYDPVTQTMTHYSVTSDAGSIFPPNKLASYAGLSETSTLRLLGINGEDRAGRRVLFVYGGVDQTNVALPVVSNDLYVAYKNDDRNWVWTKEQYTGEAPPPTRDSTIIYDRQFNRLLRFFGFKDGGAFDADTWAYYFDTKTWRKETVHFSEEVLEVLNWQNGESFTEFATVHDKARNKLFTFGGLRSATGLPLDFIIEINLRTLSDSLGSMSDNGPGPRRAMAWYYDGYSRTVNLMGGIDAAGVRHNDLWEYDMPLHTWTKIADDTSVISGVVGGTLTYSKPADSFYYFGGQTETGEPDPTVFRFNLTLLNWHSIVFWPWRDMDFGQTIERTYVPENTNRVELPMPQDATYPGLWSMVAMDDSTGGLDVRVQAIKTGVGLARGVSASPVEYTMVFGQPESRYEIKIIPSETFDAAAENRYTMRADKARLNQTRLASYRYKGTLRDVELSGKYGYALGSRGLEVLDMDAPATPKKISQVIWAGLGQDVEVRGNYAYIANGALGLTIVDLAEKAHPKVVGHEFLMGVAREVVVSGLLAYVATGAFGVQVVDVSDPTDPKWIDTICNLDVTTNIAIDDGTLAASGLISNRVRLFDISTASRNQIAQYKATERTSDLRIYDGRLHVLLRNGSADVVDVRNPKSPVKLTTYAGNDEPFALKVAGKYAAKKERNNVGVYQFEAY